MTRPIALGTLALAALLSARTVYADEGGAPPPPPPEPPSASTSSAPGEGTTVGLEKDQAVKSDAPAKDDSKAKSPFRGSVFLFDQSATVNSFSKGAQLSYSPLYQWWLSPRVYYSLGDHVKFGARFDVFKEMFTNHEETTTAREWVIGDPWLTASYSDKASFINKHEKTRWNLGLLLRPPLSKESRANGTYFSFGPTGSLTVGFDLAGKKAKAFQGGSVGIYAGYSHAFSRCTTPCGFGFDGRPATNAGGQTTVSDQVRSGTLAGNTLIYSLNAGLDILENLGLSASYIVINQFSYAPPDTTAPHDLGGTGTDTLARNPNDTRLRQLSWFLVSLDWDPTKELTVGLGYYNLNSVLGQDGRYRNPFFSPDARVFLGLTAHLDAIYDDLTKTKRESKTARKQTPHLTAQ